MASNFRVMLPARHVEKATCEKRVENLPVSRNKIQILTLKLYFVKALTPDIDDTDL
jgi:hypothetical protein